MRKTWISLEEKLAAKPVEDRLDIEANFPRSLSGSSWWVVGDTVGGDNDADQIFGFSPTLTLEAP